MTETFCKEETIVPNTDSCSAGALRRRIFEIWQKVKRNEPLEGEEKIYADLMQQHDEWHNTWEFAELLEEHEYQELDENPFVHIAFDAVIVNQLTADEPEGINDIYNRLRQRGLPRLDALHEIAGVFATEFYEISRGRHPYSDERYMRELKKLL
ncbi:MAG: DUF1841 family protein [Bacteroidetes bacterium]|nr:DUF1841 family protein [Bacteroidota bacterium]MCW5896726.1 DUF1841 family protein [Bacteroidota bacterium]